jgi:hypothetical protein
MKRRKDFASLLRQMERPSYGNTSVGIASSIAGDGKAINGQNYSDGETRDLHFALPYGISSSGMDGIRIQIITNDNQNNVVVGVIDKNRPKVRSGCITIYDKSGSTITLDGDGGIAISNKFNSNVILSKDGDITINAKNININGDNVKISGNTTINNKNI